MNPDNIAKARAKDDERIATWDDVATSDAMSRLYDNATWASDSDPEAAQFLNDLLAPADDLAAHLRRAQRDIEDARVLLRIVREHHGGLVEGLTDDDRRTLIRVAFRLTKAAQK
ncbi:MAG TPA: hypothetical protein VGN19_05775 [Pedococcus sp.]|jgi:hypothetical protein|nr:hypothetical protein [Pedococcus sp.]